MKQHKLNHAPNIMSKCHNILPTRLTSLFQVPEKITGMQGFKINFLSRCFIRGDSHIKIICLRVVFTEHGILYFDTRPFMKHYLMKVNSKRF